MSIKVEGSREHKSFRSLKSLIPKQSNVMATRLMEPGALSTSHQSAHSCSRSKRRGCQSGPVLSGSGHDNGALAIRSRLHFFRSSWAMNLSRCSDGPSLVKPATHTSPRLADGTASIRHQIQRVENPKRPGFPPPRTSYRPSAGEQATESVLGLLRMTLHRAHPWTSV